GDSIANFGFNVMLGATNHATDMGISGLYNFYDYMHNNYPQVLIAGIHGENITSKIPHTVTGEQGVNIVLETDGTASDITPEEAAVSAVCNDKYDYSRIGLLKIKDYTFAILNYTYGNNTEIYPTSSEGHLDFLTTWNPDTRYINFTELNPQVLEDIKLAKTVADVVIVCPHWGVEYTTTPTDYQVSWAKQMTEAGADVIIGAHPHVPEPVEWVSSDNGNESLCYYSLGNYVSTQNQSTDVLLEGLAWVSFHVTEEGISITKDQCGIVPLVNHYSWNPLRYERTYLLEDYSAELAGKHGVYGHGGFYLSYDKLQERANTIFGDKILTREQIFSQFDDAKREELISSYDSMLAGYDAARDVGTQAESEAVSEEGAETGSEENSGN
ncbi:MAG: CapA family protein, partial [Lachnospiraceae bacterium]|nr:CapA family protein [Lachnospiraceae bacterium]